MLAVTRHRDLIVPGQSGEHEHHPGRGAEVRFGDAALDETYDAVKPQRVRIGGDPSCRVSAETSGHAVARGSFTVGPEGVELGGECWFFGHRGQAEEESAK